MGNPDFIVIINDMAFVIYSNMLYGDNLRQEAVNRAIEKYEKYLDEIDQLRAEQPGAADPDYSRPEIETIRVYYKN